MKFDPSQAASKDSGIFGLPFTTDEAKLVLISVPWEVTTSYGDGTSNGPKHIHEASHQVDLFDLEFRNAYSNGIAWDKWPQQWLEQNNRLKPLAKKIVEAQSENTESEKTRALQTEINAQSIELQKWLRQRSLELIAHNKIVGVVGGDHSSPLGLIQALSEKHGQELGILHIDAHADLRNAYQGFQQSHASIFHNVMELAKPPGKLVQLGIRDFCQEEWDYIHASQGKIETYFDQTVQNRMFAGETWKNICQEVVSKLPNNVYVSFDIDGLEPTLCPNTGTPVAGGLSFAQATFLLRSIVDSGRKIVGFDLCEVAPSPDEADEWNGNVGARLLYKLCGWTLLSNGYKA